MGCDHKSEHRRRSAATGRPSDAMFLFFPLSPKGRTVLKHIAEEAVSGLLGVLQVTELQGSMRVGGGSVMAPRPLHPGWVQRWACTAGVLEVPEQEGREAEPNWGTQRAHDQDSSVPVTHPQLLRTASSLFSKEKP